MGSPISSVHNERVKYARSLSRRPIRQREGRFIVEGTRLVDEMVRAGVRPALVFCTSEWETTAAGRRLLPALSQAEEGCYQVTEVVLAACSGTETPQGVLAIAPFVHVAAHSGLILILDRLRDPGNLGTILRSAEAAAAGQIILAPGTVDLYNSKVVRAAMGAHFRLATADLDWPAIRERVAGRAVWLATPCRGHGEILYDAVDWQEPSALIVGGEATGPGEEATTLASGRVCIPMAAGVESLNAAMAATVILFEAARQRRVSQ